MAETYANVWDALEDDPLARESLKVKSRLMQAISAHISERGMTQAAAAKLMDVTQPRISDLVRGKIDLFTIDMLVNMLARAGLKVEITIQQAA